MVSAGVPVNPAISNLFSSKRYPFNILDWGTGLEPVVLASRFTAFASFTEGRLNTISLVTNRFLAAWKEAPGQMIQSNHNETNDDIATRLTPPQPENRRYRCKIICTIRVFRTDKYYRSAEVQNGRITFNVHVRIPFMISLLSFAVSFKINDTMHLSKSVSCGIRSSSLIDIKTSLFYTFLKIIITSGINL